VLVVLYLRRANRSILEASLEEPHLTGATVEAVGFRRLRLLWVGLMMLAIATPLGLLAPGTAWGEWGSHQLAKMGLAFVPHGLAQLENLWGAPMAGYDVPALGNASLGYVLSGVVGIVLVAVVAWLFSRLFSSGRSEMSEFGEKSDVSARAIREEPRG
jgi:hypothetical protein